MDTVSRPPTRMMVLRRVKQLPLERRPVSSKMAATSQQPVVQRLMVEPKLSQSLTQACSINNNTAPVPVALYKIERAGQSPVPQQMMITSLASPTDTEVEPGEITKPLLTTVPGGAVSPQPTTLTLSPNASVQPQMQQIMLPVLQPVSSQFAPVIICSNGRQIKAMPLSTVTCSTETVNGANTPIVSPNAATLTQSMHLNLNTLATNELPLPVNSGITTSASNTIPIVISSGGSVAPRVTVHPPRPSNSTSQLPLGLNPNALQAINSGASTLRILPGGIITPVGVVTKLHPEITFVSNDGVVKQLQISPVESTLMTDINNKSPSVLPVLPKPAVITSPKLSFIDSIIINQQAMAPSSFKVQMEPLDGDADSNTSSLDLKRSTPPSSGAEDGVRGAAKRKSLPRCLKRSILSHEQEESLPSGTDAGIADPKAPLVFPCNLCSTAFTSQYFLAQHRRWRHKAIDVVSSEDPKPYWEDDEDDDDYLQQQYEAETKTHKCLTCGLTYSTSTELTAHVLTHVNDEKRSSGQIEIIKRRPSIQNNKTYTDSSKSDEKMTTVIAVCHFCGMLCTNASELIVHLRSHDIINRFKCGRCLFSCTDIHKLEMHLVKHTGARPIRCVICSRDFSHITYLKFHVCQKQHFLLTTGNKIGATVQNADDIQNEIQKSLSHFTANGGTIGEIYEEGSIVPIKPEKAKSRASKINNTSTAVQKQAPTKTTGSTTVTSSTKMEPIFSEHGFECPYCGKIFRKRTNMDSHIRIHTGERPYSCSFCGHRFYLPGDLKRHIRIHTGEKPYKCIYCDKAFARHDNLKSHMRVHTK